MNLASDLIVGTRAEFAVHVRSLGPGTIGGETQVTAEMPDALMPLAGRGSGWRCQTTAQQLRCVQSGTFGPGSAMPDLRLEALVRATAASVTTTAVVDAPGDTNDANDRAEVTASSTSPIVALQIRKTAATDRVIVGGSLTYSVEVANVGNARVVQAVLRDLLPRGFQYVDSSSDVQSTTRSLRRVRAAVDQAELAWPLGTLSPGETVTVTYRVVVGAEARAGPQDNRATVSGIGPRGTR